MRRPNLRFVDAREYGGFWAGAAELLPKLGGRADDQDLSVIGYRHMVTTHNCRSEPLEPAAIAVPDSAGRLLRLTHRALRHHSPRPARPSVTVQCHFMSLLWFRALKDYEYAMRVDEDVCITRLPSHDFSAALSADYAFGLTTKEAHRETVETFNPWVSEHLAATGLRPTIPPLPTDDIYFTNFFVTRIGWWRQPAVRRFLDAVNASGGIYLHRWGDAPIQTAVIRLLATPGSALHLALDYVHLSTHNRIVGGTEVAFGAEGVTNEHFRRLVMQASANATNGTRDTVRALLIATLRHTTLGHSTCPCD